MKKYFALALAALTLAACGNKAKEVEVPEAETGATEQAYAAPSLAGEWQLVEYTDGEKPLELNGEYVLTLTDSTFVMQTDCNSLQGYYEVKADSIAFLNPMKTEMACDNEAVEQAMTSLAVNARTFWLEADTLTVKTETAEAAKFAKK
ncbi:MAG: META domain-containing protein [Muribaculaceae bacterium]|nr:META domain-containing protein [Muribaculaceae bacterium]